MQKVFGEYGGEVVRGFTAKVKGENKEYRRGEYIPAEDTKEWALINRKALMSTGKVIWYASPFEDPNKKDELGEKMNELEETNKQQIEALKQLEEEKKALQDEVNRLLAITEQNTKVFLEDKPTTTTTRVRGKK